MKKSEMEEFYSLMSLTHEATTPNHKAPSPEKVRLYFTALCEYPFRVVRAAFERVIKEKTISTFPLVGEILEAISAPVKNKIELDAHRAFSFICKVAHRAGIVPIVFEDPLAEEAARISFGGVEKFSQMPVDQDTFNRKVFVDIYKKLARERIQGDLYHVRLTEGREILQLKESEEKNGS